MRVLPHDVAAISVGLIDGKTYLDLDYILDSNVDVDMNVVKISTGSFVKFRVPAKKPRINVKNSKDCSIVQKLASLPSLKCTHMSCLDKSEQRRLEIPRHVGDTKGLVA